MSRKGLAAIVLVCSAAVVVLVAVLIRVRGDAEALDRVSGEQARRARPESRESEELARQSSHGIATRRSPARHSQDDGASGTPESGAVDTQEIPPSTLAELRRLLPPPTAVAGTLANHFEPPRWLAVAIERAEGDVRRELSRINDGFEERTNLLFEEARALSEHLFALHAAKERYPILRRPGEELLGTSGQALVDDGEIWGLAIVKEIDGWVVDASFRASEYPDLNRVLNVLAEEARTRDRSLRFALGL